MPRPPLPIDGRLPEVVAALDRHGSLVLTAPPGTGKTTRVPPALAAHWPQGSVVVLEPRRLAARAAARRVARELGERLGETAGYQVRNDRRTGPDTRIRFVTEGVLVRQLLGDPFLEGVAAVVLDEFHERHLEGDLALAMLQEVRETVRPDLRLLAMSATLDTGPLRDFLGAPVLQCDSPLYPVVTEHLPRRDDRPLPVLVRAAVEQALQRTGGDVLVFVAGAGEIRSCAAALAGLAGRLDLLVLPLHGRLPAAAQDRVLLPQSKRKVVLATNVAESSLTIEGITAVVDSGYQRLLHHDADRGLDVLRLQRISQASAEQRRGRAGRTGPGLCLRLWTAGEERAMPPRDPAEIRRVDLASAALQVRAFARRPPQEFRWFEAPDPAALERADLLLADLGALDAGGAVTGFGRAMLELPLHPRLAAVALAGRELGCPDRAALATALLSEWEGWRQPGAEPWRADLLAVLAAAEAGRAGWSEAERRALGMDAGTARAVFRLYRRLTRAPGAAEDDDEALARCLLAGYPDRVVRRLPDRPGQGLMVGGRAVALPDAAPDAELLLALAVLDTGQRRQRRARVGLLCPIDRALLPVATELEAELDADRGRVVAVRRSRYRDLVLAEARGGELPPAQREELLRPLLARDLRAWLDDPRPLQSLLARLAWLRRLRPDLGLVAPGEAALVEAALAVLPATAELGHLRGRDVAAMVTAGLPETARAALAGLAPAALRLPSGRRAVIDYGAEAGPTVAARIQELFGCEEHPRIGDCPLVLQILAPNQRPVQVTSDLPSFWRNIYPRVRRELGRRYPRHSWPEDPLAAAPEARPGRRRRR